MTTPVTLPLAFSSDATLWASDGPVTLTVTQQGGSASFQQEVHVRSGTGVIATMSPLVSREQLAADIPAGRRVEIVYNSSASNVPVPFGVIGCLVDLIAGGGGGGSGRRGAAGSVRSGGAGGGGGAALNMWIAAAQLGATYSVSVGAGGPGGAAVTTDDTNGTAGSGGNQSTFASGSTSLSAINGG